MRTMRGIYKPLNFPMPTDSLQAPAAAGPMIAAAATTAQSVGRRGRRAGMGDATSDTSPFSGIVSWIQNNAGTAAAIGLGILLVPNLFMSRGRR